MMLSKTELFLIIFWLIFRNESSPQCRRNKGGKYHETGCLKTEFVQVMHITLITRGIFSLRHDIICICVLRNNLRKVGKPQIGKLITYSFNAPFLKFSRKKNNPGVHADS